MKESGMQDEQDPRDDRLLLSAVEFAQRRNWRVDALAEACKQHRIFCLIREGVALYPAFFADSRYVERQLEAVTKRLGSLPDGSKWQFYTTGKGSLGGMTPLEALRKGRFKQVLQCADGFVER